MHWVARRNEMIILAVLAAVLFIRYPVQFAISPPYLMDFNVYRTIATRLMDGRTEALYVPTSTDSDRMVFKYAPPWAICSIPLAWLSPQAAAIVWTCIDLLALLITLIVCSRLCRFHGLAAPQLSGLVSVAVVLLITRPLSEEIGNGQTNLLWGALTIGFVLAATLRRQWLAAALLSSAILLKLPAAIFLPYLLLRRQWGLLWRTIALACGLTVAGSALLIPHAPLQLVGAWAAALFKNGTTYAFEIANQSLLALLGRLFTNDGYGLNILALPQSVLPPIAAALIIGLLLLIALPRRPEHPARFLFESALLMLLMVLGSPSGWPATYTVLVLPIFLAIVGLIRMAAHRRWDLWMLLPAVLALICNLLTRRKFWNLLNLHDWHGEGYLFMVFMTLPLMGLLLLVVLFRQRRLLADLADPPASSPRT